MNKIKTSYVGMKPVGFEAPYFGGVVLSSYLRVVAEACKLVAASVELLLESIAVVTVMVSRPSTARHKLSTSHHLLLIKSAS